MLSLLLWREYMCEISFLRVCDNNSEEQNKYLEILYVAEDVALDALTLTYWDYYKTCPLPLSNFEHRSR